MCCTSNTGSLPIKLLWVGIKECDTCLHMWMHIILYLLLVLQVIPVTRWDDERQWGWLLD